MNCILLTVKVSPNSFKNEIIGWEKDILKVKLRAVPKKGAANQALIDFLAKILKIPKSSIELFRGHQSKIKILKVYNLEEDLKNLI